MIPLPLDGDPDAIADHARVYKTTALRLKNAADDLRDLTDDSTFVSLAVDEVRLKALDARTATESIHVRYDGAADAMSQYAIDLRAAQDRATRAINNFTGANGEQGAASRLADDLEETVKNDNGQTPNLVDDFLEAKRALERFAASTQAALDEYNAAVQDKMDAVTRAITALKDAADTSALNDGFFEAIGGAFQGAYEWAQENLTPLLEKLHEVLSAIGPILDLISTVLSIVAIFVPVLAPLAAAVKTLALVVAIATLACSVALVLLGKGSLGAVVGEGLGLAVGALLGAGAGKAKTFLQNVGLPAAEAGLTAATRVAVELPASERAALVGAEYLAAKVIEPATDAVGGAVGNPFTIDLAPSVAGPSWNVPPTIKVDPVNTDFDYTMPTTIEAPFTGAVLASAAAPGGKSMALAGA